MSAVAGGPRVLFWSPSRRGLGHVMRSLNVARALRGLEPTSAVLVAVTNPAAATLAAPETPHEVIALNDWQEWQSVCASFGPDVVVFDTLLPQSATSSLVNSCVYMWRHCKSERQAAIAADPRLAAMQGILVPHSREEFAYPIPDRIATRTVFVGPIVRQPDRTRQAALRTRYGITDGSFVLTSTAGGGGFAESANWLLDLVGAMHDRLAVLRPDLRHIVVRGPLSTTPVNERPGMTVVDSEPDLIDLMAISDLVLAEAGYNTVQEIRQVKVPAVLIPGERTYDDQAGRARALEHRGLARVVRRTSMEAGVDQLVHIATDRAELATMRAAYASDFVQTGNQAAAEYVLRVARAARAAQQAGVER